MNNVNRIIGILIFFFILTGCSHSSSRDNFIGSWTQSVTDEANHISGSENLELLSDGKLTSCNDLRYAEKNEFFDVNIKFTVSIDGSWEYDGRERVLRMKFDTNTYHFAIQPNESEITMAGDGNVEEFEKIKEKMMQELSAYLGNMYRGYYEKLSPDGITLTDVSATTELKGNWNGYSVLYLRSRQE